MVRVVNFEIRMCQLIATLLNLLFDKTEDKLMVEIVLPSIIADDTGRDLYTIYPDGLQLLYQIEQMRGVVSIYNYANT